MENFNKSVEITKTVYGDHHPSLVATYINIADAYRKQDNNEKVEEFSELGKRIESEIQKNKIEINDLINNIYVRL